MINKIIDGISEAIFTEFGDGYDIYTESIEQGLIEPCFSILCLNPTNDLFLGKKQARNAGDKQDDGNENREHKFLLC